MTVEDTVSTCQRCTVVIREDKDYHTLHVKHLLRKAKTTKGQLTRQ